MKYYKVILIGIDGADPKIMQEMISKGDAPNFSKLARHGTFSRLETTIIPQSPVAWSTIATGCNPGKHNVFDFIRRDAKTYLPKLAITEQKGGIFGMKYESPIKAKPFWEISSDAGISTTVIRWPLTFPPSKIKGSMLSGLGVPDIKGLMNSYIFYTDEDNCCGEEGFDRVTKVEFSGNEAETSVSGPMGIKLEPVSLPMKIKLEKNGAVLIIDGEKVSAKTNSWSNWVRARFKVGIQNVYGIFRVFLAGVKPFKMYMTSVQIDPENPAVNISSPKEFSKELAEKIGLYTTLGMPEDTKALEDGKITEEILLQQIQQINEEREKMFWNEFEKFSKGIFAFVFDSSDRIQHCFFSRGPQISREIKKYYKQMDLFLGKVLAKIDKSTALFIISDHGFTTFERAVSINTWLWKNGFMKLSSKPTENDAGDLFRLVEWSGTKAYSLGFSGIYINVQGREGQGIVAENEKEKIIDSIIKRLKNLKDGNKKVITSLYKSSEIYSGDFVENSPDILVGFEPGYRMAWQNAVGGMATEIISDNKKKWKGDHIVDPSHVPGVIFSNIKIKNQEIKQAFTGT